MLSEEYIANVLKTASHDWPSIKGRLSSETVLEMLHAAIGMSTEAAELLDMLKKHIFYGKKLDLVNIEEEIGDSDWYKGLMVYALRCSMYATSFEQIWEKNIEKLRARYGESFSESCALNRDLEKERAILEKGTEDAKLHRLCCVKCGAFLDVEKCPICHKTSRDFRVDVDDDDKGIPDPDHGF